MPRERPSREEGRLFARLLRDDRTHPDEWTPEERAAVTRLHLWAHGAPPNLDRDARERPRAIRVGDPAAPLPSELLASCDAGRGIEAFILSAEVLDHLPVLMRDEVPSGGLLPAAHGTPPPDDPDRFSEQLLADLRRLGDEYGPLGVAIAAATLTDPRVLVAQIDPDRAEPDEPAVVGPDAEDPLDHTHDGCEANLDALRAEVARLTGLLDAAAREADRADEATTGLLDADRAVAAEQQTNTHLRGKLRELEEQLADARQHADAEHWRAEQEVDRGNGALVVVDRLREFVADLRRRFVLQRPEHVAAAIEERVLGERVPDDLPPGALLTAAAPLSAVPGVQVGERLAGALDQPPAAHPPVELPVAAPGVVTCDGRTLRVVYNADDAGKAPGPTMDGVTADPVPHEPIDLRPVAEDPRRPHPDAWPDDAVLLTYRELRRLVALHLDRYADARTARAMLDGDVPLRLAEVLT